MQPEFPSSPKKPNIKTVAAAAGVSTATVSNAFNRPNQLSPEVRERVLKIARELGYSGANPVARNLRRMSTNTIGFVYSESLEFGINDPACQQFLQGIAGALESRGLGLLLLPYSTTANFETVRDAAVDGIILYSPPSNTPLLQVVKDRRLPAVFVDFPARPDCTTIRVRDRLGGRALAEHLIQLGHKRFGVISSRLTEDFREGLSDWNRVQHDFYYPERERLVGYRQAFEEANIDLSNSVKYSNADIARPCSVSGPSLLFWPLTTVRQDSEEKGCRAAKFLLEMLDGQAEENRHSVLPVELIVRKSTAKAR